MKFVQRILLLVVSFSVMVCPARAKDAEDLFLQAFQEFQAGEKLEKDGSTGEALLRYKNVIRILEEIKNSDPTWMPNVVEYRGGRIRENIERIEIDLLSK